MRAHGARVRGKAITITANVTVQGAPKWLKLKTFDNVTLWEIRLAIAQRVKKPVAKIRIHKGAEVRISQCLCVSLRLCLNELLLLRSVVMSSCATARTHLLWPS